MHPYDILKRIAEPILLDSSFRQTSEKYHPDFFGSAYSIFEGGTRKVRLIWDGKDGWGYAQVGAQSSEDWKDIDCFVTEDDLESVPMNEAKIEEFRIAISNALKNEL